MADRTSDDQKTPEISGKDARAERLAAALRENLRKRKAQARGRTAVDESVTLGLEIAPEVDPSKP